MLPPNINANTFSKLVGGDWQRTFARHSRAGKSVFVFENRGDCSDIRVLRNDISSSTGQNVRVPHFGDMICHSCSADPAFVGLNTITDKYVTFDVLRYRPGKRITIAAIDECLGPIIIKYVASGIDDIYKQLCELHIASDMLTFKVSKPLYTLPGDKIFVQERIRGRQITSDFSDLNPDRVRDIAAALKSLHRSNVRFPTTFSAENQRNRSARYAQLIGEQMPDLSVAVDALSRRLRQTEASLDQRPQTLVPIHGSPHSHQWLLDGDNLGLVDFDRAALGHMEVDVATFLAEFDYEPPIVGAAVNGYFLREFLECDWTKLSFYRAHKHLAKAFKASKHPDQDIAQAKTARNLARAMRLLDTGSNT